MIYKEKDVIISMAKKSSKYLKYQVLFLIRKKFIVLIILPII